MSVTGIELFRDKFKDYTDSYQRRYLKSVCHNA